MRIKLLDLNFRFHKCLDRQWRLSQFYFSYSTKVCRKRKTWAGTNWLDEVFWSQRKKGVVQTLIFQNEGGGIGNRILNPCLTFLWCSMFLLWLFCVINSGCINPGAPRNVYQYTEQIHSQFRISHFPRKSFFGPSEYIWQFFKRVRWKKDGRLDCQIRWKSTQLADEEYMLIRRSIFMEHFDKLNLICVESLGILDSKYIPPWSLGSRTPYNMFSFL